MEPEVSIRACGHALPCACPTGTARERRIAELKLSRPRLIDYLKMKLEMEDWHGVQDAASDLRDLDSEMDGLLY